MNVFQIEEPQNTSGFMVITHMSPNVLNVKVSADFLTCCASGLG